MNTAFVKRSVRTKKQHCKKNRQSWLAFYTLPVNSSNSPAQWLCNSGTRKAPRGHLNQDIRPLRLTNEKKKHIRFAEILNLVRAEKKFEHRDRSRNSGAFPDRPLSYTQYTWQVALTWQTKNYISVPDDPILAYTGTCPSHESLNALSHVDSLWTLYHLWLLPQILSLLSMCLLVPRWSCRMIPEQKTKEMLPLIPSQGAILYPDSLAFLVSI